MNDWMPKIVQARSIIIPTTTASGPTGIGA